MICDVSALSEQTLNCLTLATHNEGVVGVDTESSPLLLLLTASDPNP